MNGIRLSGQLAGFDKFAVLLAFGADPHFPVQTQTSRRKKVRASWPVRQAGCESIAGANAQLRWQAGSAKNGRRSQRVGRGVLAAIMSSMMR
ncbi:hypothetical protein P0D72_07750 [Paraburkholderia sediminicola]|uniref:hypothetical protein n=1 Tax=Paraburkholderia sediminicola TaxID=458836 RepID=UPI0038B6B369